MKGVILSSSGYLRVNVRETEAKVDCVRTAVPGVTKTDITDGTVEHSYTMKGL